MSTAQNSRPVSVGLRAKLMVAAVALLVGAGLCELAARVVYPAPPEPSREPQILYQYHPDLGFLHVPNQTGWLDDGQATINAMGLRGDLPETPKPANSVRILAIGDSTTFGWGVNDDGTYCAALQRLLRQAIPESRPTVINGGVGAYDLKHELRLLRHFAPMLKPDIVLVGLFWNDLPYEKSSPDGVLYGKPPSEPVAAPQPATNDVPPKPFRIGNQPSGLNRVLRSSRALYVLRHAWLAAVAPTAAATNLVQWEMALLDGRKTPSIDDAWKDIEGSLKEIRAIGADNGFAVGVVIIPIRAQVEGSYPHAAYQTRVRAIAESLGIFVVDPLANLIAQPDHKSLFIPYDRMHLSSLGNEQIGRAAFESVRQRPEFHGPHAISGEER
jgi:lysophospholipase L1-like esterase